MVSLRSHHLPLFIAFTIILLLNPLRRSAADSDSTAVIYKQCANQSLTDPNGSQSLSNLYGTLIQQSSKSRFYKTTATSGGGSGGGQSTITGLFQCRGDLSNVDCYACVSNLPTLIDKQCPNDPVASRLQLYGCYVAYEVSGYGDGGGGGASSSGLEVLYKSCSGSDIRGSGFEEKRDTALYSLQNGFTSGGGGGEGGDGFYYAASYEGVYAMGQCEGDLGSGDCVDCVRSAVQRAQVECGSSVSGMVFLSKCFMSYSYYPHGAPKKSSSASASFNSPVSPSSSSASTSSSSPSFSSYSSSGSSGGSSGTSTGKTVAMILGGAAIVGFLIICVSFAKGAAHRKDGY